MNVQLKKTAVGALWLGFGISLTGFALNAVLGAVSHRLAQSFAFLITMGNLVFLLGCINYARAKGQPWYVGLLGLCNLIGFAILVFLVPDKS